MELDNKEDVDPLVLASSDLEGKINDVQNDIDKKLRPILAQLNEDGEPSLTIAQDKSTVASCLNNGIPNNAFLFSSRRS